MGCESNYQISIPSNQFIIQKRNLYTQSPILRQRSEAEVEGLGQVSLPPRPAPSLGEVAGRGAGLQPSAVRPAAKVETHDSSTFPLKLDP